jgi:branched-chain amino acid aminotransferase
MGVTRSSILEIANDLGIPTRVAPISVEDVYHADELFFSGTAVEVTAIREVDGHVISGGKPGPVTRRIQETFNTIVRGQRPEYRRWLSYARERQPVTS